MSKADNIKLYAKSINIVNTPSGLDQSQIKMTVKEGNDRVARVSYGEDDKGVYVKFIQPSMMFNDSGEKVIVELTTRQRAEWEEFFQAMEVSLPDSWADSSTNFISPLKEEGLQVKIVKPDSWSPNLECASVSLSLFAWRFGENCGVSLSLFPPSNRKSGSKRPRTEEKEEENKESK